MRHLRPVILLLLAGVLMLSLPTRTWSQFAEPNPGIQRPVTSQDLDVLKRKIYDETRSNIVILSEYHSESGDPNNRLNFYRVGAQLNLKLAAATVLQVRGTHTPYSTTNDRLTEWGSNATLGLRSELTEHTSLQFEAGGTRFSTDRQNINALGAIAFSRPTTTLRFTGSRSSVEESVLSATGIRPTTGPFAGELVGQVMDNRFVVDGSVHPLPKLEVFANGGGGVRNGSNVESNTFRAFGGGGGYNLIARADDQPLRLVRASYSANYFGFDKNLLGFGGASLSDRRGRSVAPGFIGSDGISPIASVGHPGVGGYFSPEHFFSHVIGGEVAGHPTTGLDYEVSGFVGSQYYTGSPRRSANGFSATVTLWLSDRYSVPVTFLKDNFGPFSQQSFHARLVARF